MVIYGISLIINYKTVTLLPINLFSRNGDTLMRTKNYLTINEPNVVQLHGFEEITDYIYVEIFEEKRHLLFLTRKRPLKVNCFEVSVVENRQVKNNLLYDLIKEFNLENKRFWADEHFKNYVSTDIEA